MGFRGLSWAFAGLPGAAWPSELAGAAASADSRSRERGIVDLRGLTPPDILELSMVIQEVCCLDRFRPDKTSADFWVLTKSLASLTKI